MVTVDKWAFPPEDRYFPCSICNKPRFHFPNELTDECKPAKPPICIDCYIPENPTRGWMLTQAKKLDKFDFEHYKMLGTDAQQETYLRKILKISKRSKSDDDTENQHSKDDR